MDYFLRIDNKILKNLNEKYSLNFKSCTWETIAYHSIRSNNLELLKQAIDGGYIPNKYTFIISVDEGNMKILEYLVSIRCPMSYHMWYGPIKNHDDNILSFLHKIKCPWDEICYIWCIKSFYFSGIVYFHKNKYPWTERTYKYALEYGDFDFFESIHNMGCPRSEDPYRWAIKNGKNQIADFLLENDLQ